MCVVPLEPVAYMSLLVGNEWYQLAFEGTKEEEAES